jgi:hypothetical protein
MADLAVLKAAVDAAEAVKETLLDERRTNRDVMSKQAFRDYNESTRAQQKNVEADVAVATEAFQDALKVIRADAVDAAINVAVGTLHESNSAGGAD